MSAVSPTEYDAHNPPYLPIFGARYGQLTFALQKGDHFGLALHKSLFKKLTRVLRTLGTCHDLVTMSTTKQQVQQYGNKPCYQYHLLQYENRNAGSSKDSNKKKTSLST